MGRKSTRYGKRPAGRMENTCFNSNTHTHKSVQKMVYPGGILKKKKRKACEYRNRLRKAKAHLELKVKSDLKSKREEFLYVFWQ